MIAKTQLQEVRESLAKLDPNNRDNLVEIARLKTREAELVNQVAMEEVEQQEREQRDQRQQEIIQTTTSVDILSQMFDSLLPAGQFEVILGPNRYDVLSQDFKQMIQAYATEALQSAHQQHDFEIAHKDERIKLLNDQSLAVQLQLDEANIMIENLSYSVHEYADRLVEEQAENSDLKSKVDEQAKIIEHGTADNKRLINENGTIRDHIAKLNAKLEAAQQPKESKPSQTLSEMMTEIKTKNQLTADDMLARWNARQKSDDAKIPLPEVKVTEPGNSFRPESDHAAGPSGDSVSGTEAVETVGAYFPVTPPGIPGIQTESPVREVVQEPVTRAELETRLVRFAQEHGLVKGAVA